MDLIISFNLKANGCVELYTTNNLLVNIDESDNCKLSKIEESIVINNDSDYRVQNLIKPDMYNIKKTLGKDFVLNHIENGLYLPLIVEVNSGLNVIDMYLLPTIYEDKEYIEMKLVNIKEEKIIINTNK